MNAQKRDGQQRRAWLKAYHYIDAFAGPGIAVYRNDPEIVTYLEGSPLRILAIQPEFDHVWLIDRNTARLARLRANITERGIPNNRFSMARGDANSQIRTIIAGLASNERALVFLDPYGLQVEWSTVESLAASNKVDILINYSLMGITRNLRRIGGPTQEFRRLLSRVMKRVSWIDQIYTEQGTLLGDPVLVRGTLEAAVVAQHYQEDLKEIFATVSAPAIMTNSRGSPIYALVFASQNKTAASRIMNSVVAKRLL
jgi:three-Cys-motif partner protein